jgi:hypothetical protein
MDFSGFMALVALFLGAGELVTTPVPKDKQVGRAHAQFSSAFFSRLLKQNCLFRLIGRRF